MQLLFCFTFNLQVNLKKTITYCDIDSYIKILMLILFQKQPCVPFCFRMRWA